MNNSGHINTLATRDGFGLGLVEAATNNERVYALCADLTKSMRMDQFEKLFAKRFVQLGVAEQNLIGVAAGLALAGKIPFAASFAVFSPGRSWDQIRVSVAYSNLNVKIVGGHAGLSTGQDGATHQALEDIALMRVLPNMKVVVPCDGKQAKEATMALANDFGPAYLRLSRSKLPILSHPNTFHLGKAEILQPGNDLSLIACGNSIHDALEASKSLAKRKLSVRVINMHTIKPIDKQAIIDAANETQNIITVEDHQLHAGLGSAVSEIICQELNNSIKPDLTFEMIAVNDCFGESGNESDLKKKYQIDAKTIENKALKLLKNKLYA